ncbi:MAG: PQQ-binding-like beta-propeller repeat protein [Planctomycetota bacterium]
MSRPRAIIVQVCVVLLGMLCLPAAFARADWPFARKDVTGTGFVHRSLPADLVELWKYEAGEAIETSPVIGGDLIVLTDVMGSVHALDRKTGKPRWKKDFDSGFDAAASLQIENGKLLRIVVADIYGAIHCLRPEDGGVLWALETDAEISAAATFVDGRVLVTSQDGKLQSLDLETGKIAWVYQADDQLRCSPTVVDGLTFVGGCDAKLHRIDLSTGMAVGEAVPIEGPCGSTPAYPPPADTPLADKPTADASQVNPADSKGKPRALIVPSMAGIVFAIQPKTGEVVWRYDSEIRGQEYQTDAAVNREVAIVTGARKTVDAISLADGKRLWRYPLRKLADASPVIAGQDVWVASTDGRLTRLDIQTGKQEWMYEIRGKFSAPPAIDFGPAASENGQSTGASDPSGRLIVADDDGVVLCFGGQPTVN